jgi:hypothetical protein
MTSWRHFSSVEVAPRKRSCTFFSTGLFRKHCLYRPSCRFFIRKIDEISRSLRLMHDGAPFDKILPRQEGYFGARINWKQRQKKGVSLAVENWHPHNSFVLMSSGKNRTSKFWNANFKWGQNITSPWKQQKAIHLNKMKRRCIVNAANYFSCQYFMVKVKITKVHTTNHVVLTHLFLLHNSLINIFRIAQKKYVAVYFQVTRIGDLF